MLEGWASEVLAAYLGQFLDVQREQLRVSLFSGASPPPPSRRRPRHRRH
jgi:hypothetical protein